MGHKEQRGVFRAVFMGGFVLRGGGVALSYVSVLRVVTVSWHQ